MEIDKIHETMKNSDTKTDIQVNGLTAGAKKLLETPIKTKKQLKRFNNQTEDSGDLIELININRSADNEMNISKNLLNAAQNIASNELTMLLEKQASPKKILKNKIANERNNKNFEDVENKMEEMFAGIDDTFVPNVPQNDAIIIDDDLQPTDLSMNKNRKQNEDSKLSLKGVHSVTNALISTSTPIASPNVTSIDNSTANITNDKTIKNNITKVISASSTNIKVPPKKRRKITKKANQKGKGKQAFNNTKSIENKISLSKSKPNADAQQISEYKSPYIQIKSDGSEIVVNGPLTEEVSEKQGKKPLLSHSKIKNKTRIQGLHNSTLSTKYDAHTTDASWLCVFCKKGPHKEALGDLFGPYVITTECEEYELCKNPILDEEYNKKRIKSEMIKSNSNSYYVVQSTSHSTNCSIDSKEIKKKKKSIDKKLSQVESTSSTECIEMLDLFEGMIKITDNSYEVWVHEDCAIWSNGIYLIGAKLIGLELAVWNSFNQICTICTKNGAIMQCLHRGCEQKAHYICAKLSNWNLNEDNFKMHCETHSISVG